MRKKPRLWPYVVGWLLGLAFVVALVVLSSGGQGYLLARVSGLITYLASASAIVSSAFVRPLAKRFGRPFVKLHHILATVALAMALLHPLGAALSSNYWSILLPRFGNWLLFLTYAGAPAAYLFHLGAIAARLRARFAGWRVVHALTFLAFWFATAHALLIGSDTQGWPQRVAAIALAIFVLSILIKRRLPHPSERN